MLRRRSCLKSTMFKARSTRHHSCCRICFNALIITLLLLVILLWFNEYESRPDYLSTPFIQPWFPAIFSSYRVKTPDKSQSPYLSEFKNPCYLKRDENRVFGEVLAVSESERKSKLSYPARVQIVDASDKKSDDILRCLPHYFVLGWAKSGTTDLNAKMMAHPHILRAPEKEPAWFNSRRFRDIEFAALSSYIDYYDYWVTSRMAIYFHRYGPEVPLVVGDHSTHTIDIHRGGDLFAYNNKSAPTGSGKPDISILKQYSNPVLIKQLVPQARFIVIMRDPVERIFSLYRMHESISLEDFHDGVVLGINTWENCMYVDKRPIGECMYFKLKQQDKQKDTKGSTWRTRAVGSIRRGIYYLFLAEWFSVFPRKQFLALKFENYARNSSGVLNEEVFPHLDLPKLSGFNQISMDVRTHAGVRRSRPKKTGNKVPTWRQGDMKPETRTLLRKFYAPYNKKLAKLLQNDDFDWAYD